LQRRSNQVANAAAAAVTKAAGATLRSISKGAIGSAPSRATKAFLGTQYGGYKRQGLYKPKK